ncbi:flagellar hook-length control protein FliK [Paenibacillus silvisoli]|uniref:flagellar hook-length control protein FliK n=1 Tax=Paenibacillus silvisoli TaxID=3110539 RepID=UPI002804DBDE|nr:flagellar hook-length control protein FliK [Paenibacillus silvisoli]
MQMSFTNAALNAGPTKATGTASAKGAENGNDFGMTLVQTLTGSEGGAATNQTAADLDNAAAVPMNTLASILGENLSSADLLGAIDALLRKLNDTDTEQLAQSATESDLSDALVQLDNLLSMLAGMQPVQHVPNVRSDQEQPIGSDQTGAAVEDGTAVKLNPLDNLLGMLAVKQPKQPVQNALDLQEQSIGGDQTVATAGDGSTVRFAQPENLLRMLVGMQSVQLQNALDPTIATVGEGSTVSLAQLENLLSMIADKQPMRPLDVQEQTIGGPPSVVTNGDGSADSLVQLDNLLRMLAGMQNVVPIQNVTAAQEQAAGGNQSGTAVDGLLHMLAGMQNIPAVQEQTTGATLGNGSEVSLPMQMIATLSNLQAQASAVRDSEAQGTTSQPTAAATVNFEVIDGLKSDLQEALTDLRLLVKQQKSSASGRELNAIVSKQLTALVQLLSPTKNEAVEAIKAANVQANAPAQSGETDLQIRTMQSAPSFSNHLQRIAHQFMHVGILKESAMQEQAESQMQQAVNLDSIHLAALTGNQELQRQQMAAAKQVISHPVPVQQFASTVQGMIVGQFNVTASGGLSNAQLTLYPEHLGQVNVNITMHNGTLTAQFMTDTVTAKDLLDNQMAQLRSALQAHGLQVEKLEVSQSPTQSNLLFQERQGQSRREQNSHKQNGSRDNSGIAIDFNADLEEVPAQRTVDRYLGLGRGIHTKA